MTLPFCCCARDRGDSLSFFFFFFFCCQILPNFVFDAKQTEIGGFIYFILFFFCKIRYLKKGINCYQLKVTCVSTTNPFVLTYWLLLIFVISFVCYCCCCCYSLLFTNFQPHLNHLQVKPLKYIIR